MKVNRYFARIRDCYILGPSVSLGAGEARVGFCLILFEIGLAFETNKVYSYGCSGCNAIGHARVDELPPGWQKRYSPDRTYHFLCGECRGAVEPNEDYLVTDETREQAVDEIIGQLTDREDEEIYIKALRGYANKLLDESEPFGKFDLSASVCAYADGWEDARG